MRGYMLRRYKERMSAAVEKLGGKCSNCGAGDDLQLDHIDPNQKSFNIARKWSISEKKFWQEVSKCQLLCQKCHTEKTLKDLGRESAKDKHGTISSYRYCKCEECLEAKKRENKKSIAKRRLRRKDNPSR